MNAISSSFMSINIFFNLAVSGNVQPLQLDTNIEKNSYNCYNVANEPNKSLQNYTYVQLENDVKTYYYEVNSELMKNLQKLNSFYLLEDNWNGYGSLSINPETIETVKTLIATLKYQPDIFPTGRNSVQLQYEKINGDYLEFEIYSKDKIGMLHIISENEIEMNVSIDEIQKQVENFYA